MAGTSRRGFALMDPERQREIARKGGRAAHEKGTAHQFSSDEARQAGRKGGMVVSNNREHMVEIGRSGGRARRRTKSDSMPAESSRQPGGDSAMLDDAPERMSQGAANGESARSEAESAPDLREMASEEGEL